MFSKTHRIYVDTSVFGGCFDKEFETPSKTFFEKVRYGYPPIRIYSPMEVI